MNKLMSGKRSLVRGLRQKNLSEFNYKIKEITKESKEQILMSRERNYFRSKFW